MIHTNRWIYLDPDHRKKDGDGKCVRCKKRLTKSKVMVEVSDDGWYVRLSEKSNLFIGKDCWKQITREK